MFKPSDLARRLLAAGGIVAAAAGGPASALAAVSTTPPRDAAAPARVDGGYQIRCWQHGRLLFEENHVTLPPDGTRYALRIAATDRTGRPLYVAQTDSATCLIRAAADAPTPATPGGAARR
ncbi:hypothetical protein [Azohydromonas sp.]|uniref:hypothetical protein n=1 Tax=Azohydromonas sp. TaxID=1872666 RepID=UPI002B9EE36C|nr:hypothetical protein [Azohydromonas sp.]HMM84681.1 hypothetical protein [Azohydromonas sp.]